MSDQQSLENMYNKEINDFSNELEKLFTTKIPFACTTKKTDTIFGGLNHVSECKVSDFIRETRELIDGSRNSSNKLEEFLKKDKIQYEKHFSNDNGINEVVFKVNENGPTSKFGHFRQIQDQVQERCVGMSTYLGNGDVGTMIKICIVGDSAVKLEFIDGGFPFLVSSQSKVFFAPREKSTNS